MVLPPAPSLHLGGAPGQASRRGLVHPAETAAQVSRKSVREVAHGRGLARRKDGPSVRAPTFRAPSSITSVLNRQAQMNFCCYCDYRS